MARQEFEKGQRVMLHVYTSRYTGEHWEERVVVEPVGHATGYGWHMNHVAGEPGKGKPAYVGFQVPSDKSSMPYLRWVVNAKNRILSLADYEPKRCAQARAGQAREDSKQRMKEIDQERIRVVAAHLCGLALKGDNLVSTLTAYFNLKDAGKDLADRLRAQS